MDGDGDDLITGGNGNDSLDGGAGDDLMNGGENADLFVFALGYDTDRINMFEQSIELIEFDDALWTGNASIVTGQDVVDAFGTLNGTASILTLDFDAGDVLEVQNSVSIDALTLGGDILIV